MERLPNSSNQGLQQQEEQKQIPQHLLNINDSESGQEGDYEESDYGGKSEASARAQYNQQNSMSHLSNLTMNTNGEMIRYKQAPPKQRQIISALAMSQNEVDQDQDQEKVDALIQQEMIHQSMISQNSESDEFTLNTQMKPLGGAYPATNESMQSMQNDQDDDIQNESNNTFVMRESRNDGEDHLKTQRQSSKIKQRPHFTSQQKSKNRTEFQNDSLEASPSINIVDSHFEITAGSIRERSSQNNSQENESSQSQEKKNSQDEIQSQSYKGHSNNSPDDSSILAPGQKQPKQLKWVLVSEGNEQGPQPPVRPQGLRGLLNNIDQNEQAIEANQLNNNGQIIQTPQIKNHTATLFKNKLYIFGGYDGKKNHYNLRVFDTERDCWLRSVKPGGNPPQGRNGHTATLVKNRLYIIGGWLGQGPFAADDMHILDIQQFKWLNYEFTGEPPGPCNMHTADSYEDKIYVFRGGDGRDYLNDLHELNTSTLHWRSVQDITGMRPPPRANHSSSIIQDNLYIFGGWDGSKRLNDLFVFNLKKFIWSQVSVIGESPAPRAGMELCNVSDKLFLFGGSGPHAFCFNDLYTFDPISSTWEHCNNFRDPENNPNPKARAGHSMTLVDCKLYIIGGSYGQDYLKDVYILDTDPCPDYSQIDSDQLLNGSVQKKLFSGLRSMLNQKQFSDVTFIVEGKPFYGHKIIISQLSEKLNAMFSGHGGKGGSDEELTGFIESKSSDIKIDNVSYPVFQQIMQYLYSGEFELGEVIEGEIKNAQNPIQSDKSSALSLGNAHVNMAVEYLIDFLRVADEYLLEDVKFHCQNELIKLIDESTFQTISEMGELYNADRIVEYCQWFQRRKMMQYSSLNQSMTLSVNASSNEGHPSTFSHGRYSLSSTIPQKSKH